MKPLLCLFLLFAPVFAQKPDPELVKLRDEFKRATQDYKESLTKLAAVYENNIRREEEKFETAKLLHREGLLSKGEVDRCERAIASEKAKLEDTKRQIANADQEAANMLTDAQLAQEYKKAVTQRRRSYSAPCRNWRLSAYRRENKSSITIGYKFVCDK